MHSVKMQQISYARLTISFAYIYLTQTLLKNELDPSHFS